MAYIITGGTRGIGLAIAQLLSAQKKQIIRMSNLVLSRTASSFSSFPGVPKFQCDVSNSSSVQSVFSQIETSEIPIQGLINSAGVSHGAFLIRDSFNSIQQTIDTNLLGSIFCAREVSKLLFKRKVQGSIVNIASVVGSGGYPGIAPYAASKAGVIGFTKSFAVEMGSRGIRVNAVSPGFVETDMTKEMPPKMRESILEKTPLRRFTAASEVAKAVLFLLESQDVTGSVLTVDCGLSSALI